MPIALGHSLAVVVVGWIVYAFLNSGSAREEVGSEIELAANRKPYYDDEVSEGRRLERVQLYGVLLLVVVVIGLPLYWIFEPSRMTGAQEAAAAQKAHWGALIFAPTGDNTLAFNCAGCHGGMNATGGEAPYTVTDTVTGEVRAVNWKAPALNTVFYRFSRDEVRYIIEYGRPGSPMSAWGLAGGGPMNFQQIDTVLDYLETIQIPREDCAPEEEGDPLCESGHLPADIQADIEQAARAVGRGRHLRQLRRGAVQPRPEQRRVQLRTVPHDGLELRRPRRAGSGRLRLEPHGWEHRHPLPRPPGHDRLRRERVRERGRLRTAGPGQRAHARLRRPAHRRTALRHHRIRAGAVMGSMLASLLAVSWELELRGTLIVIIAVVVLCGSIYMILATNLGARLGFLVALAGLAGWMTLMGLDRG